jgi:hypothetical protein
VATVGEEDGVSLQVEQFVTSFADGHEREFKLTVESTKDGWEAVLYIPACGKWEQYAKAAAATRIDTIQAIAHYVVTA